jgi:hypothetical protein
LLTIQLAKRWQAVKASYTWPDERLALGAELPDAAIAGLGRAGLIQLARALKAECDALGIGELPRLGPKPSDDETRAVVREVRDRVARERERRGDDAPS